MIKSHVGVILLWLLVGCGSDGGNEPVREGLEPEAFCTAIVAEACAAHARCCDQPQEIDADCTEHVDLYCTEWVDTRKYLGESVEVSQTEYRPDLAQAELDAARAAFATCAPFRTDMKKVFFAPRLSVGDACLDTIGCPSGSYCYGTRGEGGVCRVPPEELGAPCGVPGTNGYCGGGLVCGPDERCITPLALGAACVSGWHCASNVCADDVCTTCIPRDDNCIENCDRFCWSELVCEESACVEPVPASRDDGEPCEFAVQCSSGICGDRVCLPETTPGYIDSYCFPEDLVRPVSS